VSCCVRVRPMETEMILELALQWVPPNRRNVDNNVLLLLIIIRLGLLLIKNNFLILPFYVIIFLRENIG